MRTPLAPIGWPNDLSPPLGLIGMSPLERRAPLLDQLPPSPFGAEAEVLDVRDLGPREAVVHLGEVDVLRA